MVIMALLTTRERLIPKTMLRTSNGETHGVYLQTQSGWKWLIFHIPVGCGLQLAACQVIQSQATRTTQNPYSCQLQAYKKEQVLCLVHQLLIHTVAINQI